MSGVSLVNNMVILFLVMVDLSRLSEKGHCKTMWKMSLRAVKQAHDDSGKFIIAHMGEGCNYRKRTGVDTSREDGLKGCFGNEGTNRLSQDLCSPDDLWTLMTERL